MKRFCALVCCIFCCISTLFARKNEPILIYQVTDPQMGFYHDNRDMDFEISKLSLAVEKINKAHPDMVVLTGDYVHDPTSQEQWNEFLRIIGGIDQSIRTVVIPGNHDVLDKTVRST